MEEEDDRADPCEGTIWSTNPVEFFVGPGFYRKNIISNLWGPTTLSPDWTDHINLICMCVMDIGHGDILISSEICKFGDYGIIVTNIDEFISRVDHAVKKINGYDMTHGHVKYSDIPMSDLRDTKLVFHKREHYKDEKEYRISVYTGSDKKDPLILNTGGLTDIAHPLVPKNS